MADEDVAVVAAQVQAEDEGDELVSISEAGRRLGLNSRIVYQWYKNRWLKEKGRGSNRVIFVSWKQAQSLDKLRVMRGGMRGRRLIPRGMDLQEALHVFL